MADSAPPVTIDKLSKTYGGSETAVKALDSVSLTVAAGEFLAVMGPSGSGKSSLLHCAAGLDRPTRGRVRLMGTDLARLSDAALSRFRRRRLGFIFQSYNLLPTLTAADNIRLAAEIAGLSRAESRLQQLADQLGLAGRLKHRPAQLSGGQQQRVAVARALITEPQIIFADEPTGNLDSAASDGLVKFLAAAVADRRLALVMVTHDPRVAARAGRVVFLHDGRIVSQLKRPTTDKIFDQLSRLEAKAGV